MSLEKIAQDVIDLRIYDENGKFLTELKHLKKGHVSLESSKIIIQDALFNIELFKNLGSVIKVGSDSDFEKDSKGETSTVIRFSNTYTKKFKLIARTIAYDVDTAEADTEIEFIIPNAVLRAHYDLLFEAGGIVNPTCCFNILPFNDNGDLYDLKITNRNKNR